VDLGKIELDVVVELTRRGAIGRGATGRGEIRRGGEREKLFVNFDFGIWDLKFGAWNLIFQLIIQELNFNPWHWFI